MERVEHLRQQLADTQAELASLQAQYSLGEKRLARASKLMAALGNEAVRWTAAAEALTARLQLLPGARLGPWLVCTVCSTVDFNTVCELRLDCRRHWTCMLQEASLSSPATAICILHTSVPLGGQPHARAPACQCLQAAHMSAKTHLCHYVSLCLQVMCCLRQQPFHT